MAKVIHVGTGRTNPAEKIPSLLLLHGYLDNGFIPGNKTSLDIELEKSERVAERLWIEYSKVKEIRV